MSKLTSMIVKLFLPEVSAGACIGDAGCCCSNPGRPLRRLTCTGACVSAPDCRVDGRCNA